MQRLRVSIIFGLILLGLPAPQATAQDISKNPGHQLGGVNRLSVPPAERVVLLIRSALLTLSDALLTGNYTVLRDRGSPAFRAQNTAASLARVFSQLDAQKIDLAVVAIMSPELSSAQIVETEQRLVLKGNFSTQPQRIVFDLTFEPVNGQWQIFALSVGAIAPPRSDPVAEPHLPSPKSVTPPNSNAPKKK